MKRDIWEVESIEQAKKVILTGDTDRRWNETWKEIDRVVPYIPRFANIVDFGCGIGRIASYLLNERNEGYRIHGVETSDTMRAYATSWVSHEDFTTTPNFLYGHWDFGIFSLVLQHMEFGDAVDAMLEMQAYNVPLLYVHNLHKRAVWDGDQWTDDKMDIRDPLKGMYREVVTLPAEPSHWASIWKIR